MLYPAFMSGMVINLESCCMSDMYTTLKLLLSPHLERVCMNEAVKRTTSYSHMFRAACFFSMHILTSCRDGLQKMQEIKCHIHNDRNKVWFSKWKKKSAEVTLNEITQKRGKLTVLKDFFLMKSQKWNQPVNLILLNDPAPWNTKIMAITTMS